MVDPERSPGYSRVILDLIIRFSRSDCWHLLVINVLVVSALQVQTQAFHIPMLLHVTVIFSVLFKLIVKWRECMQVLHYPSITRPRTTKEQKHTSPFQRMTRASIQDVNIQHYQWLVDIKELVKK